MEAQLEDEFEKRQELAEVRLFELRDKCHQLVIEEDSASEEAEEDDCIAIQVELQAQRNSPFLKRARSVDMLGDDRSSSKLEVRKISQATAIYNHRPVGGNLPPKAMMNTLKVKKASIAQSVSTNLSTLKSTKSMASLTRDQRKQVQELESNYATLQQKMGKLADSEQTQELLAKQLKKFKALVASKQDKLSIWENDLAQRKRIIEKKQEAYDDQVVAKCTNDKETLVRLRHKAKTLKSKHSELKKQVLTEATTVKAIDQDLTDLLQKQRERKDWIVREEERVDQERNAFEKVLREEEEMLAKNQAEVENLLKQSVDQCRQVETDIDAANRRMSMFIQSENEVQELHHGILDEEERIARQIADLDKLQEALAVEIGEIREGRDLSSCQMQDLKREEMDTMAFEKELCHLMDEVRQAKDVQDIVRVRTDQKEAKLADREQMLADRELDVKQISAKFRDEEEAIDEQTVQAEAEIHALKKKIISMEQEVAVAEYNAKIARERHLLESSIDMKLDNIELQSSQFVNRSRDQSFTMQRQSHPALELRHKNVAKQERQQLMMEQAIRQAHEEDTVTEDTLLLSKVQESSEEFTFQQH